MPGWVWLHARLQACGVLGVLAVRQIQAAHRVLADTSVQGAVRSTQATRVSVRGAATGQEQ